MGLGIYETANPSNKFSQNGALTNAICFTFDGIKGGTLVKKLYVRNDDSLYYYDTIKVTPVIKNGPDIISGVGGFHWKLIAGDTQPLEDQWDLTSNANTISLANLGSGGNPDTSTFLPFWVRVTVPAGTSVQSLEGVRLDITTNQNLA